MAKLTSVKYIICPGYVTNKDGVLHYISAKKLIELYEVEEKECFILDIDTLIPEALRHLPLLSPLYRGDYKYKLIETDWYINTFPVREGLYFTSNDILQYFDGNRFLGPQVLKWKGLKYDVMGRRKISKIIERKAARI